VAFGPPSSTAKPAEASPSISRASSDTSSIPVEIGTLVGIRFLAWVCHECEFCLSGREQHCPTARNHLHHRDGSFQEYIALDRSYLTVLPQDIDPVVVGPVLCAGLTAYKVDLFPLYAVR
jgi:alcohol dehydrogenase, propanol-preferring